MARSLFNATIFNQKTTASNRCNGPKLLKDESFNSSNLSGMSKEELCDVVIELQEKVRDIIFHP